MSTVFTVIAPPLNQLCIYLPSNNYSRTIILFLFFPPFITTPALHKLLTILSGGSYTKEQGRRGVEERAELRERQNKADGEKEEGKWEMV